MGVVEASEAKGESNKRRSGPEWARAAIAGGCYRRRLANHTSSRPAVRIAETPAAGPATRWGSHAQ